MDKKTRVDSIIDVIKDNRILSVVIVFSIALIGIANLTDALSRLAIVLQNDDTNTHFDTNTRIGVYKDEYEREEKFIEAISQLSKTVNTLAQNSGNTSRVNRPCPFDMFRHLDQTSSVLANRGIYYFASIEVPDLSTYDFRISYKDIVYDKEKLADQFIELSEAFNYEGLQKSVILITAHSGFVDDYVLSKVLTNHIAELFKELLVERGVAECRILVYGAGNEKPYSKQDTLEAKLLNQRVEIKHMGKPYAEAHRS